MAMQDPNYGVSSVDTRSAAPAIDQGLRTFMLSVYNHMALGVALTGLVALGVFMLATTETGGVLQLTAFGQLIFASPLKWVAILAPFAIVLVMSFGSARLSASTARLLFYAYATLIGVSMASIFLIYTGASIARVFFVTAASFGALSLYGYTTKRDLSAMGSFMMMGLFGLIIGSLVNLFLASGPFQLALTLGGVVIFAGLTAWDTQKLKLMYSSQASSEETDKLAIYGALDLYLDFINLFMMLLRLLGDRR
ncbi:MAG: Bax inhibitor-1 family protein [Labrys sp. (in: a-proteobacteria)]